MQTFSIFLLYTNASSSGAMIVREFDAFVYCTYVCSYVCMYTSIKGFWY
jgi:hypothetical protein